MVVIHLISENCLLITIKSTIMKDHTLKLEDRLILFAGDCIHFCLSLPNNNISEYYFDQILRASGAAALNFGEALGTNTGRDFIHKTTTVAKELKEVNIALKILDYINYGDQTKLAILLDEVDQLIAISTKMTINAKAKL